MLASHYLLKEEVVAFEAKRGARTEKKIEKRFKKVAKLEEEPHLSEEEQEAAQSQPRKKKVGVWSSCEPRSDLTAPRSTFWRSWMIKPTMNNTWLRRLGINAYLKRLTYPTSIYVPMLY